MTPVQLSSPNLIEALSIIRSCVCAQLAEDNRPVYTSYDTILNGVTSCCTDEFDTREGSVTTTIKTIDAVPQIDGNVRGCLEGYTAAITLGVWRCLGELLEYGEDPPSEVLTQYHDALIADYYSTVKALACCEIPEGIFTLTLGQWSTATSGGCIGGNFNLTINSIRTF